MKNRIAWKLLLPVSALVVLSGIIVGWQVSTMLGSEIELGAKELEKKGVESVVEILKAVSKERVDVAMKYFIDNGLESGSPSLGASAQVGQQTVSNLLLGGRPQANNFTLVDHVQARMGGTATLFVKQGDGFVRISTNVKKPDGARAVGTVLDPNGMAIRNIREGRAFYGVVDILGKPYVTGYEPIRNSSNAVIGIWYVGYPLASLGQLGGVVAKAKILEHGFIAVVDSKGDVIFKSSDASVEEVKQVVANQTTETWVVATHHPDSPAYGIVTAHPESDITDKINSARARVALIMFGGLALMFVTIYFMLTRIVLKPVKALVDHADVVSKGDLSVQVPEVSEDELGELARSFNLMVQNLRGTLEQLLNASEAVASSSSEISSSTEQMAAGAHEQTSQAADVAAAVEEMTKTIGENSRNAAATVQTAEQAMKAAEQGTQVVQETIDGMRRIASVVKSSSGTVQQLGKSSDQIGAIVDVIDDIANQTNLLALNAAIEAARAGDQGRGFAVVADEVRKLAERTTKATKEIAEMIKRIQVDTAGAVASMEQGTTEVENGMGLAERAGVALNEIMSISKMMADMIHQIAVASEEQSSTSELMSRNISGISSVTSQTAHSTQQIASAAEDLNKLTETLKDMVGNFKLHGGAVAISTTPPRRKRKQPGLLSTLREKKELVQEPS
ncbi:MAG: Cache 3/Cache 2 fusion domain-containing protein [Ignavibacteriae bacterium]|nr:Cache 3/Cache 2 fusion domain-containing protein [Ignavibacteriota bacterium]